MEKKYFKFFFIIILFYIIYLTFLKKAITNILLTCGKKIHQYSFFLKNNVEILKLVYQYKKLEKEYEKLRYLEKEILLNKKRINNSNTYNQNFIFAEVIGYIFNKKNKFFFINRGSVDGLNKNMIVVEGITILGKIVEVYDHCSKVLFLDNDEQYISAVFENSNSKGILKGNRNNEENTMSLVHLYNETQDNITIGERVYSSGKGLLFPPGYLIGSIKKINKINSLENHIIIQNAYNIKNIEYCDVIINDSVLDIQENTEITPVINIAETKVIVGEEDSIPYE
jgi:rod shape-determining protein MreC